MSSLFRGLIFKVANGSERERALHLRREVYARDWPHIAAAQVVDRADEAAHQLIALNEGDVVASLRIVPWEQRPFDLERFIALGGVVPPERRPAEIGRLCVRHERRHVRSSSFVHLGMLKLAVDLSRRLGTTDFVLTALPELRNFYRRGCFSEVGIEFDHTAWGLVYVMRFDLLGFFQRSGEVSNSVERVLRATELPNFIL